MADISGLPEDIMFDIFLRMPKKPFLRLRCLSKHWNRLILDHLMKLRSRRRMILLPLVPFCAIDTTVPGDFTVHSTFNMPSPFNTLQSKDHVIFCGAFNGLVLLVIKDNFILFNPFTGAFKIVPRLPFKSSYERLQNYGFGYGTKPDDLKIIRLRPNTRNDLSRGLRSCDVFCLKKGSWSTKSFKLVRRCLIRQYAGTFLNGFLYWIATEGNRSLIVALDVKEMVFSKIQLPFSHNLKCLGAIGGRLHLFHVMKNIFEVWVMEKDGIEKSFSKVLTSNGLAGFHVALSIIDVGKIVMLKHEKQVIIYDMLENSYKVYEVNASQPLSVWRFQAMEYVESLISPSDILMCSTSLQV